MRKFYFLFIVLAGMAASVSAQQNILVIGLQDTTAMMRSDSVVIDALMGMDYNVWYTEDDSVNVTTFDFSPYDAAVIGEAASSGKLVNMVANYGYPLPIVNLKGFMMRYDKWGWVQYDGTPPDNNDYPEVFRHTAPIPTYRNAS